MGGWSLNSLALLFGAAATLCCSWYLLLWNFGRCWVKCFGRCWVECFGRCWVKCFGLCRVECFVDALIGIFFICTWNWKILLATSIRAMTALSLVLSAIFKTYSRSESPSSCTAWTFLRRYLKFLFLARHCAAKWFSCPHYFTICRAFILVPNIFSALPCMLSVVWSLACIFLVIIDHICLLYFVHCCFFFLCLENQHLLLWRLVCCAYLHSLL